PHLLTPGHVSTSSTANNSPMTPSHIHRADMPIVRQRLSRAVHTDLRPSNRAAACRVTRPERPSLFNSDRLCRRTRRNAKSCPSPDCTHRTGTFMAGYRWVCCESRFPPGQGPCSRRCISLTVHFDPISEPALCVLPLGASDLPFTYNSP